MTNVLLEFSSFSLVEKMRKMSTSENLTTKNASAPKAPYSQWEVLLLRIAIFHSIFQNCHYFSSIEVLHTGACHSCTYVLSKILEFDLSLHFYWSFIKVSNKSKRWILENMKESYIQDDQVTSVMFSVRLTDAHQLRLLLLFFLCVDTVTGVLMAPDL